MRNARLILAALLATVTSVHGLLFTPGSDCQALCSDGAGDQAAKIDASDIVCNDKNFTDSGRGIKFKNCITCLQKSESVDGLDSDAQAFLYNLRYAFDVCVYSYPEKPVGGLLSTVCTIEGACPALGDGLKTALVGSNSDNVYDYCDKAKDFDESGTYGGCIRCLKSSADQKYFANFLVALKAGCEQRPKEGAVIGLSGDLFTTSLVNITEPEEDISKRPKGAGSNTLTTGAIVGIAAGCGLALLGAAVLIFIYCRRQRRSAREKLDSPPPDTPGRPRFISTKHSNAGLPSNHEIMSESLPSFNGRPELAHKRSYSSNADYYDSFKEHKRGQSIGLSYDLGPSSKTDGSLGAIPAHPAYIPRVTGRNSERSRSPPGALRSNPPDSYALRTYLNAAEPTNPANPSDPGRRLTSHHSRSFSQPIHQSSPPPGSQTKPPPPPPSKASRHKPKVPSLVLPSLSKAKAAKTYEPPQVIAVNRQEGARGLAISGPLAVSEPRFEDRPLGGGQVMATKAPPSWERLKENAPSTSPMLSGHSRILYG